MYVKRYNPSYLLIAVALLLFCLFAACDTSGAQSGYSGYSQHTPTASDNSSPTAQRGSSSPLSTTSQANAIYLITDKSAYSSKDSIVVTITNSSAHDIYLSAYYSNCTPVQLQIKGVSWMNVGTCPERTQSTQVLPAGDSVVLHLHPAATGGFQPRRLTAWTPGLYRIFFTYVMQPDPDSAHGSPSLTSSEFVIHK